MKARLVGVEFGEAIQWKERMRRGAGKVRDDLEGRRCSRELFMGTPDGM